MCEVCKDPGDEERLLFCENCDKGFHTFCLEPPLETVPEDLWYCKVCAKHNNCSQDKQKQDAVSNNLALFEKFATYSFHSLGWS